MVLIATQPQLMVPKYCGLIIPIYLSFKYILAKPNVRIFFKETGEDSLQKF